MKVGDLATVKGKPEYGAGRIVRFHANQGTMLIEFPKDAGVMYCDYLQVESYETR
tara:strand:- start:2148 stop:2312 length:165 start_codon:yes stop_codon:yes gene_type:complete